MALGPRPRDYTYGIPKKVRRAALCSALSLKVQEGVFKVVDRLDIPDPKTKHIVTVLKDLGVGRRTLILLSERDRNIHLASRNLPDVQVLPVVGLNVYDLLLHDHIICTKDALTKLQERVG